MKVHLDLHDRWVLLQGAWHGKTGSPITVMHKFIGLWYHLMYEDERAKLLGWAQRLLEVDTDPTSTTAHLQRLFMARYDPSAQYVAERQGERVRCFRADGVYHIDNAFTIPQDEGVSFTPFDITTAPERYTDAVRLVYDTRKATLQHLQRHLKTDAAETAIIRAHMVMDGLLRIEAGGQAVIQFRSY